MEVKKSSEADLGKKRFALFMIGLILTLGIVLSGFEYQEFEKKQTGDLTIENNDLQDEQILDIPPPPPPVAPPPPPPVVTEIEVVKNDEKVDNNVVFVEENPDDKVEIVEIKVKDEPIAETIFDVVEENAEFPGGLPKMYEFLANNMKYPPMAKEAGVQGKVYVQFIVFKDGSIGEVKVLRGIGSGCDEEAMRVVKAMPKWNPGKQRKVPVSSRFNLPIVFKLQ